MAASDIAGKRVVSPALVGREPELSKIVSAVSQLPSLMIIDGEAGIGKTRLVTELSKRPELAGRRFLVGRCHGIRESFPLGPVVEAVRELGTGFAAQRLSSVVGVLRSLLPEIADALPRAPLPLDDRAAERHRVFRALAELLAALGPVVLVIEDLHWADEQTVDFVGYLLGSAAGELAIVVTFRGDELDPRARSMLSKPPTSTSRTEIVLQPLDAAETGRLAAAIVGADHVSEEFARYLCERASGLPFAIEELLALLRARGDLVRRGGRWARRALDELDVPSGIRDPVLERVGRFTAAAKAVAEAAAVLQVPVSQQVLSAAARIPADQVLAGLEEALESGLLSEHGKAIGFRHLLAAQAVYEEIPGPRRRDLHGRAAAALRAAEAVPLGQVAHHLRHAGRLAEWVGAAEQAAGQALELGHDAEAFRLLEDLLRYAPLDPHSRGRLAVRLAEAAIDALRAAEVVDLISDVLEHELPAKLRGEVRFRLGMLIHDIGEDPLKVRRLLTEAVDELGHRPDLQAWAMVVLGIPTAESVRPEEHWRWLRGALDIVPKVDDPVFEVFLLGKIAMVMVPFGDTEWRGLADRIVARTGSAPRHRREVNAYLSVGAEACYAGHVEVAEQLLPAALDGAIAGENRRMELSVRSGLVLLRYCGAAWDGLTDEIAVLVDELAEHPRARIDVEIAGGALALVRGQVDDARSQLARAVDLCFELGGFDVLPIAVDALTRLELAGGGTAEAERTARRWITTVDAKGIWAPDARALPAVTAALVASGGLDDARSLLDRFAAALARVDAPLAEPALQAARGFLENGAGRPLAAARTFAAAAGLYELARCEYEAALAVEQAATCLYQAGRVEQAEAALHRALDAFRKLGADWDAGRVTRLARRHGVSVPARHRGGRRGYGNALSPREREVAELAAMGRSNKQIAADLFLSVNTVARHVSAAMRKLEVRSRAALAHRLTADD
ncbi:MAG TPA: AAA family ATPase [Jiangellaceae bacterium]